jgi:valyl-tRNA synthetase
MRAVVPVFGQKVEIMADELVDPNFGTGIVMVCTFGDTTDILWVQKHKLQTKIVIDKNGCLTKDAGRFAGLPLSKAREEIIKELAASGALLKQEQLEQVVNVHERCGTPVEYIISKEWWIRICDSKEKWLELGNKINWYPDYMKNRYETWVNGLNADWCISRQRYFGVPFPVWYCKKCGTAVLADAKDLPVDPFVDKPKHPCKCGSREFEPERSVMDTWTTSAITPLINVKWREADERKIYPMSLRPQGHDIIRTWAFYTIAKCWMHTDEIPWTAIMINGHALDPHGKKMSKSKGNIVEAIATIDKFGADPVRYWAASAKLGSDILYKEQEILRGKRLVTKLWNASKLVSIAIKSVPQDMPELYIIDKWLLAKLSNVIETSTDAFERYEYSNALAAVENFFWHGFCDNYLEIVKQRIYRSDPAVSWTLYHAFLALLKLLAPFLVYITEELFHKLYPNEGRSIHIASWPEPFEKDEGALSAGELLIEILTEVRNWKHKLKLPLNQPLSKIVINCSFEQRDTIKRVEEDLKAATCAREISFGFAEKLTLPSGIKIDIFV